MFVVELFILSPCHPQLIRNLPDHDGSGIRAVNRLPNAHSLVNHGVVGGACESRQPGPEVLWVSQQTWVVGAHIQGDGQQAMWRQASCCTIQSELPVHK
jgi:hypothetical protein